MENTTLTHKKCRKCQETKPIEEFYKNTASGIGHLRRCIPCVRLQVKNYQKENLHIRRKHRQEKLRTSPHFRIRMALAGRLKSALKVQNVEKRNLSIELLGCSVEEAMKHIESQFKDGMTWDNHGLYGWHIDHKKPCASFDLTDPDQQKQCFHYTNLQPLWAHENLSKSDRF